MKHSARKQEPMLSAYKESRNTELLIDEESSKQHKRLRRKFDNDKNTQPFIQ